MTSIEWTDETWNPVTGCTKISEGCRHCYAERMAGRLKLMKHPKYGDGFKVRCHPDELPRPSRWRKPRRVFVCSMSDLFHADVPDVFIAQVFCAIRAYRRHTFQVLTKRPARAMHLTERGWIEWPPNVWAGISAEDQRTLNRRLVRLLQIPAAVRWISAEPLLEEITVFDMDGPIDVPDGMESPLHWVVCGGESGPGARPMDPLWARSLRDQCERHNVPFFFKQWGGVNKKKAGRLLDGRTWDEMPGGLHGRAG